MKDQKPQPVLNPVLSFALFTFLFGLTGILAGMVLFFALPNTIGLGSILLSFLCATPVAYILFFNSKFISKVKSYKRYLLPALILPICITLMLGWTLFQQRPENIFKVFVTDPIPNDVSNIRAHDISVGIGQEIVVAFNAAPAAIEEIIAKNKLVLAEDTQFTEDPPDEYFPDIHWNNTWTKYKLSHRISKLETITIWVNPERNTVIFRYING